MITSPPIATDRLPNSFKFDDDIFTFCEFQAASSVTDREQSNRLPSFILILVLAALPAVVKLIVLALGWTGYLWQSAYKIAQLAVPVIWRRRVDGRRGLAAFWPTDQPLPTAGVWTIAVLVAGVLAGTAMAVVPLLADALAIDPARLRAQFDARFDLTPWRAAAAVFYLFTLNAALEELHFRAWLDVELSRRCGNPAGILGSAAVFAAMHLFIFAGMDGAGLPALVLVFAALLIAGACWSLIARLPGGIHAAWLSHGLTDAGLLTWGLFWLGYFGA